MSKLKAGEIAVRVTERGDPDPRRLRLRARVPGRAVAPRREDLHDLRRHLRDPAPRDRPRASLACTFADLIFESAGRFRLAHPYKSLLVLRSSAWRPCGSASRGCGRSGCSPDATRPVEPTQISRTVRGTKREAQRVAATLESRPPSNAAGRTVTDVLAAWRDVNQPVWAESTRRDYESRDRQDRVRSHRRDARRSSRRRRRRALAHADAQDRRRGSGDPLSPFGVACRARAGTALGVGREQSGQPSGIAPTEASSHAMR